MDPLWCRTLFARLFQHLNWLLGLQTVWSEGGPVGAGMSPGIPRFASRNTTSSAASGSVAAHTFPSLSSYRGSPATAPVVTRSSPGHGCRGCKLSGSFRRRWVVYEGGICCHECLFTEIRTNVLIQVQALILILLGAFERLRDGGLK